MFEQNPSFGNAEMLAEKWSPVLDHSDLPNIRDNYRRNVTAILLENQEKALMEAIPANGAGDNNALTYTGGNGLAGFDPILISLVRRSMPNIVAYDIAGVQPMTGPTGLVFALRSNYTGRSNTEALFNEPFVSFTGTGGNAYGSTGAQGQDPLLNTTETTNTGLTNAYGLDRTLAEDLGTSPAFNTMAFTIDKTSVVAKTRALKAEYTTELAQDLKAIHGLDAETELANILSTEILAEINREVLRNVYRTAKLGAQQADLYHKGATSAAGLSTGTSVGGVYDLLRDSDGRWSAERFRGLMFQIEREANTIAKETRRGKGNFLVCSADVASALAMGGFLQLSPGTNVNLEVDDTGNLFAGTLNGKMKVYIDPYMGPGNGSVSYDFACIGYKGTSPYDAGMFYCPYVPLQMVRAINETTFQPKIGFKTRYGIVSNPWVAVNPTTGGWDANRTDPSHANAIRVNQYYRIFRVSNLHGLNAASATG
jgi:hypothetical protein